MADLGGEFGSQERARVHTVYMTFVRRDLKSETCSVLYSCFYMYFVTFLD